MITAQNAAHLPSSFDEAPADEETLVHADGVVRIRKLPDGRRHIAVQTRPGLSIPHNSWTTSYPLPLIREIYAAKGMHVCDEIMREEDPRLVENSIRHEVLGYIDAAAFAGKHRRHRARAEAAPNRTTARRAFRTA
jgi:hypothetical protein